MLDSKRVEQLCNMNQFSINNFLRQTKEVEQALLIILKESTIDLISTLFCDLSIFPTVQSTTNAFESSTNNICVCEYGSLVDAIFYFNLLILPIEIERLIDTMIVGSVSNEFLVNPVYFSMSIGKESNSDNVTNEDPFTDSGSNKIMGSTSLGS